MDSSSSSPSTRTRTVDLRWFDPLPKQLELIRSHEREVVYAGGFGSGKTLSGGFKALVEAVQNPGTVGLVARQTYRSLEDSTKKILIYGDDKPPIFPPDSGHYVPSDEKFVFHNGSEVLFRSFQDWNEKKILGPNYGFVYVDELTECSEKIWNALNSRIRHPAGPLQAWGTTNPNGHDWVWRRFHPDSGQTAGGLIIASSEENTHLPVEYLKWLRDQPKEWQKRYVDCNFDTAAGQIWDEWNREIHVVPNFDVPYDWKRFESLDHGRRNPTAVLWWAVDYDGNLLVEDGYYQPGLPAQHAAAIIKTRRGRKYPPIIAAPDAFNLGNTGQRVSDIYVEHGIQMVRANDNVEAGLLRVSELLQRRDDETFPEWHPFAGTLGPDGLGAPRLFVLDVTGTVDLRREIPDYRWKDLSATSEQNKDQPEEPRKKDDHACDALRYGAMSRPKPTSYEEREEIPATAKRTLSAGIMDRQF